MKTLIDWISFSVPIGSGGIPDYGWSWEDVKWQLEVFLGESITGWLEGENWAAGNGRAPYASSFQSILKGVTVFWSGKLSHALVEVSGTGCTDLRVRGLITDMLNVAKERLTRLDIATDIETDVLPFDFATMRNVARFKAHGSYTSRSGYTEYIGSRTSELFARVYRYADPHPRSGFLRIEHELKRETAKATATLLLTSSVEQVQSALGSRFGWCHPLWKPEVSSIPALNTPANHRGTAKTEFWLRTQVASSFKKLVRTGAISDPESWLREVFLSD